ncbi:MAG: hypothetical protein HP495_11720 [Nitrospira sp.]|nr:hypothetical protein [Nitrospira sp.]
MFLLIAITVFLVRRFIVKDKALTFRENVLLNPKVKAGGQQEGQNGEVSLLSARERANFSTFQYFHCVTNG